MTEVTTYQIDGTDVDREAFMAEDTRRNMLNGESWVATEVGADGVTLNLLSRRCVTLHRDGYCAGCQPERAVVSDFGELGEAVGVMRTTIRREVDRTLAPVVAWLQRQIDRASGDA